MAALRTLAWRKESSMHTSDHDDQASFERTSKRRRGYPSEQQVKSGTRVVHGDKELLGGGWPQRPVPVRLGTALSGAAAATAVGATARGAPITSANVLERDIRRGGHVSDPVAAFAPVDLLRDRVPSPACRYRGDGATRRRWSSPPPGPVARRSRDARMVAGRGRRGTRGSRLLRAAAASTAVTRMLFVGPNLERLLGGTPELVDVMAQPHRPDGLRRVSRL